MPRVWGSVGGLLALGLLVSSCRGPGLGGREPCDPDARPSSLKFNELVAKNEGVWIDETGGLGDYFELKNTGERTLNLNDFGVQEGNDVHRLPAVSLMPGEHLLLWADGEPQQGPLHLPFRLSSAGEKLILRSCGDAIDTVTFPALSDNESFARHPDGEGDFAICRYATPGAENGDACSPPVVRGQEPRESFAEYRFPSPFPALPQAIALSELALRPARFIELRNTGEEDVSLAALTLTISAISPGQALPERDAGTAVDLPDEVLAPGRYVSVEITDDHVAELVESPYFEGVVSVFDEQGAALDRIDFMHYPDGATLARPESAPGHAVFCQEETPGRENTCTMVESRAIENRTRGLRTRQDFATLAAGGTELSTESVKIVVDVVQGRSVHLLSARTWPLHYTFIREIIEGHPPLDRCDPDQRAAFNTGWSEFSQKEYFSTTGRSYFLGTLVKHGSTGHETIEFTPGDAVLGQDMRDGFFTMVGRTLDPTEWALRPQDENQVSKVLPFEGQVPLLPVNAPFFNLVYQPLTQGEGFGVLTFVSATKVSTTSLGPRTIVVTDDVPNDIPLTGGLITQAFQTPLAHVNVLSQNRGTPNMALRDALSDERITSHLGEMVRLVVEGDDFSIEKADPSAAEEFWESRLPKGERKVPRLDTSRRDLLDLREASLDSIPQIGAKAAQLAELYRIHQSTPPLCSGARPFSPPRDAFAIPVVHFLEHFEASGAQALLAELSEEDSFQESPEERSKGLAQVRQRIEEHDVDVELVAILKKEIEARFGRSRVRLRSSSNAEDLPGFNGAGLYHSTSVALGDPERPLEDGLRAVWASLYGSRAYDERQLASIDHAAVSMGVLVHPAFPEERANGVGVSRNVLDPIRGDMYYLNVQAGEASVTNPAPGVLTEELTFQWPPRTPRLAYHGYSSLTGGEPILQSSEIDGFACALYQIHHHFGPLIDPDGNDPWFAMEIEFKVHGPERQLIVKQARPHAFSGYEIVRDCREL